MNKLFITGWLLIAGAISLPAQTLNGDEIAKLKAFLSQESAQTGRKNCEQLAIADLESVDWKNVSGLVWNAAGRLDSLIWYERNLAGDLDLSGFAALRVVHCETNSLRSLNVQGNTAMVYMDCFENVLTVLDVTSNVNLREFCCRYNQLTQIDISHNTKLTFFCGTGNLLTQIDIAHNTELVDFYCANNRLESIDVSKNRKLVNVALRTNQLTALDFSDHPRLKTLTCYDNRLETLDVAGCPEITSLECRDNRLTRLDASGCPKLKVLTCYNNLLTELLLAPELDFPRILCRDNRLMFSTLPRIADFDIYTYAPQASVDVAYPSDRVDLRSEYVVDGSTSAFVWKDAQGAAIAPVANNGGIFVFDKSLAGKTLTCNITNAAFPELTMAYRIAIMPPESTMPAEQGVAVFADEPGTLCIQTDRAATAVIYDTAGLPVRQQRLNEGTTRLMLTRGIYIVTLDGIGFTRKVLIR